jgi:hypothetical protein
MFVWTVHASTDQYAGMMSPKFSPSSFRENKPTPNSVKTTSFSFLLIHFALTDRSFHTTESQLRTVSLNKPQFKKYGRAGVSKPHTAGLCYAARGHIYKPYTHMTSCYKNYTTIYAVSYRTYRDFYMSSNQPPPPPPNQPAIKRLALHERKI